MLGTTFYKFHLGGQQLPSVVPTVGQGNTDTTKFHGLVLWSSDFHISPIADIKHIVAGYGVSVIDKSLSGHCHLTGTCERDLKVINVQNGISLQPCPNRLRTAFYDTYRADTEMATVDAFLCLHATALCELYLPFNRSLIVVASTRYEIGRHDAESWRQWNDNLRRIASSPYNVIAANNRYDQEYIKYFTGIDDVLLLPNMCGYVAARYHPTRKEILIAPARGVNGYLSKQLTHTLQTFNSQRPSTVPAARGGTPSVRGGNTSTPLLSSPLSLAHIRDLYPHFEYTDLAAHPALVILPYQVSFMSLFEFYRMEIPMFIPSPDLLTDWHIAYGVMNERTWATVHGRPAAASVLPRHPSSRALQSDPNNEMSRAAVREWVALADFYQWPHIAQFASWEDLFRQLATADLAGVSGRMRAYNAEEGGRIRAGWEGVLARVAAGKAQRLRTTHDQSLSATSGGQGGITGNASSGGSQALQDGRGQGQGGLGQVVHPRARVNAALRAGYGVELVKGCTGQRAGRGDGDLG